ncbi:MAG: glycosyltransferase family 39 protein [Chloroflexi bacterium]|nr:glycosyltransferase family 39 protein [Chloroflexota bacterium]
MSQETTLSAAESDVVSPPSFGSQLEDAVFGRLAAWGCSLEEAVAWAAVIGLTLVSRLLLLGWAPLNLDEARRAVDAYTLLHEGRVAYEGGAILTNLTSLVFGLFSEGETQARLVPALAGVGLVLTPLLLRSVLGRWWSLLSSVALLLSSLLLNSSRTLSPAAPTLLCLTVTAISWWRFGIAYERGWLAAGVVSAFVGLGLDTSFVVGLLGLVLAYAIAEGDLFGRSAWWGPVGKHARLVLAIGIGTGVLLSTRYLMNPQGIQAGLFDPLTRWTTEIARGAGLTAPLLVGMLDGSLLILALLGLTAYRAHPRTIRFLGTWLLVSLTLASLMRMPEIRYLVQPIVPAAFLAGFGLWRLWRWQIEAGNLRSTLLGFVGLVPVVTAGFQVNAGIQANASPWSSASVVLVAGLLLAGLLAFNLVRGAQAGAAFATWLFVLLGICNTAGMMRMLDARSDDRGHLIEQSIVTSDIRVVRELALKWYRADPGGQIPVDPSIRPLVEWSLRDIPTIRYAVGPDESGPRLLAEPPASVPPDTKTTRWIVGYSGDWQSLTLQPGRVWKWIVNRGSLVTLRPYGIVVIQPAGS